MGPLPPDVLTIIRGFAPLFTDRVWRRAQVLLIGAILTPGKRTVTAVLRIMGLEQERGFKHYHRVLSRARWSGLAASQRWLTLLVGIFGPSGLVVMGLDDAMARRWGRKITARGIDRDPVRSSHGHFVNASGLRWRRMMRLVPIPGAGREWGLPFLTSWCPSARYSQRYGRQPQSLPERARPLLRLLHRWLPERALVVVAASRVAALELLAAVRSDPLRVVPRLRLDAALGAGA